MAGNDYTLLVWGDPANPQYTWNTDSNRLATSTGNAKIRLLNGMGTCRPLNMSVDFAAVASSVARARSPSSGNLRQHLGLPGSDAQAGHRGAAVQPLPADLPAAGQLHGLRDAGRHRPGHDAAQGALIDEARRRC